MDGDFSYRPQDFMDVGSKTHTHQMHTRLTMYFLRKHAPLPHSRTANPHHNQYYPVHSGSSPLFLSPSLACSFLAVFYYNFAWKDMTTPSLDMALNVSQVMWWTIHINKQKVAVHCHAGLGRTGLVCACYLVLCGMKPAAAIILVRSKRLVAH